MSKLSPCPHCSARVRYDNLPDHLAKVHPREAPAEVLRAYDARIAAAVARRLPTDSKAPASKGDDMDDGEPTGEDAPRRETAVEEVATLRSGAQRFSVLAEQAQTLHLDKEVEGYRWLAQVAAVVDPVGSPTEKGLAYLAAERAALCVVREQRSLPWKDAQDWAVLFRNARTKAEAALGDDPVEDLVLRRAVEILALGPDTGRETIRRALDPGRIVPSEDLRPLLDLSPEERPLALALIHALCREGKPTEALAAARKAVEVQPGEAIEEILAELLHERGDLAEAREVAVQALSLPGYGEDAEANSAGVRTRLRRLLLQAEDPRALATAEALDLVEVILHAVEEWAVTEDSAWEPPDNSPARSHVSTLCVLAREAPGPLGDLIMDPAFPMGHHLLRPLSETRTPFAAEVVVRAATVSDGDYLREEAEQCLPILGKAATGPGMAALRELWGGETFPVHLCAGLAKLGGSEVSQGLREVLESAIDSRHYEAMFACSSALAEAQDREAIPLIRRAARMCERDKRRGEDWFVGGPQDFEEMLDRLERGPTKEVEAPPR